MPSTTPFRSLSAIFALGAVSAACSAGSTTSDSSASEAQELYGLGTIAAAWAGGNVPVCYANPADHPELQALIPGILASSWSKAANIAFTGFGVCPIYGSFVTVVFSTAPNFRGNTSTLGSGRPTVTLLSDDATPGRAHFTYEVIHEMGHALGFAHEMQRPDNWDGGVAAQCGVAPGSSDYGNYQPTPGGLNLTASYDPNSIMNYCDPGGNQTTQLSVGDILAVSSPGAYGPSGCVFAGGGTQCSAGWGTNLESTYSVPAACPATTGWVMKPVGGAPLSNACLDGLAPGACSGSNVNGTTFVLGWQQQGVVQSGPAVGTQQLYVMCDAFNNCSAPFQVGLEACDDLFLNAYNSPLQVVQGDTATANVLMVGPWIGFDHGVNATGTALSSNLPAGSTSSFSPGFAIDSYGAIEMTVTTPLSTPPGPYQETIRVTDASNGVSHTTVIPVQVLACVPTSAAEACTSISAPACGLRSLGCGLTTDCGACATGNTCTSSGVCCPNGYSYSTTYSMCMPPACPAGTNFCDAAGGDCLTPTACARLTHCHGRACS